MIVTHELVFVLKDVPPLPAVFDGNLILGWPAGLFRALAALPAADRRRQAKKPRYGASAAGQGNRG